jgi:hypothetical protein
MNSSTWKSFITRQQEVDRSKPIRICDWVETLLHFGIIPELDRQGYVITVNQQTLATCILNYLFRHEKDATKSQITHYQCIHEVQQEPSYPEEYERFCERMPESTWNSLRNSFQVEQFADSSWFADRIWRSIPNILFAHVSLISSPANIDLWNDLNPPDEDEEGAHEH